MSVTQGIVRGTNRRRDLPRIRKNNRRYKGNSKCAAHILLTIKYFGLYSDELHTGILMTGVRFPVRARDFSLLHSIETGYSAHPASYPMVTEWTLSPGSKTDDSHSSTDKIKKKWSHTFTYPYVFVSREQGRLSPYLCFHRIRKKTEIVTNMVNTNLTFVLIILKSVPYKPLQLILNCSQAITRVNADFPFNVSGTVSLHCRRQIFKSYFF
jgi:hypothetical protein